MESLNQKAKTKPQPVNRVVLSDSTAQKLDAWAEQMEMLCPGIRLKRQQLIEWLVNEKGPQLGTSDQRSVKDQFYDDVELAAWALEQLKAAKAKNEKLSLSDLLKRGVIGRNESEPKKVKKKSPPTSQTEVPQIEGAATTQIGTE